MDKIPQKYILRRWQKGIIASEQLKQRYHYGKKNGACNQMVEDAYTMFQSCIEMASDDSEVLQNFVNQIRDIKDNMELNIPRKEVKSKGERMETRIGVTRPNVVKIHNPKDIRTKGCGPRKRIKGAKEKAIEKSNKEERECHYCYKYGHHDYRTCPTRKEDERLEKEKASLQNKN